MIKIAWNFPDTTPMKKYRNLSKSQYCRGKKCTKSIWLYQHKKELADKPIPFQQNIFDQGTYVGKLATEYFPGGVEVTETYKEPEKALETTERLMAEHPPALFEPAFLHEEVLVRVDVLRNNNDGTWDLIEVKSTNSVEPKSHLDDVAIQKWVLENSGVKIKNCFLMHLNREYTRSGELDLKKLFVLEDVGDQIVTHLEAIPATLAVIKANLVLEKEPTELIGSKCNSPYICDFKSYCWSEAVPGSIHKIGRINDKKRHDLMDKGIHLIKDIPDNYDLSTNQSIEVTSAKKDDVYVDLDKIKDHLGELNYPLYFLDYESVAYAVPKFDGSWPHKHLTTQYSLHIQKSPGAKLEHKQYLHNENSDPSRGLVDAMLNDIGEDRGSVIVYHKTYERDRTRELAEMLPEYSGRLLNIVDRMWDLEVPFAKRWYWDPSFNGSSSIKNVLPVFAPEFSYTDLDIQKGDVAQLKYSEMIELPEGDNARAEIREALLRYCERDTLAMVIILEKLKEELDISINQVA